MTLTQDCPFCQPTEEDIVILETPYARAICDARPAMVGHVLVTSTNHIPSAFDIEEPASAHLRLVQQEVSWRMHNHFGEVGVYEHGRSMICRFHDINRGHVHAHLHILPVSFDLITRSGYESIWSVQPTKLEITTNDRYLYQEIGDYPKQLWATGRLPVRRHFVRSELQDVLSERGIAWIPLESSPDDHDDAVEATASILKTAQPLSGTKTIILYGPLDILMKNRIASDIQKAIDLKGRDGEQIKILTRELDNYASDDITLRFWLSDRFSHPVSHLALAETEIKRTNNIESENFNNRIAASDATWNDFRLTVNGLSIDEITDLVREAWRLRFGVDLLEGPS